MAPTPPKLAKKYQRKIDALEAELDAIWPDWRDPRSAKKGETLNVRPLAHIARIKWCLKRHMLLSHRAFDEAGVDVGAYLAGGAVTDESGFPDPRDWPVLITYSGRDGQGGGKCFAHPIAPDQGGGKPSQEMLEGPPKIDAVELPADLAAIADELGVGLEVVEDQIKSVPDGDDPLEWIRASIFPKTKAKPATI